MGSSSIKTPTTRVTVGTKSLLHGAHQFVLHPLFVGIAWWKLYGPPLDPRLWIAFFVHDLGYLGKANIDGPEGKTHPELGASIMEKLFGKRWGDFCRYHSRTSARKDGREPSLLCNADKFATVLIPRRLYLLLVRATGEMHEYLQHFRQALQYEGKYAKGLDFPSAQNPPDGMAYGSIDHWYWAITAPNGQPSTLFHSGGLPVQNKPKKKTTTELNK
jgi:hypothetical protein